MIDRISKNCTGCAACMNACPKNAIRISYESSFFYEPTVDYDLCVSCKKCVDVCPALDYESRNRKNPAVYAAYADDTQRKKSSSGAVFPVLAEYVLKNGGFVCGAAWSREWDVHHIIIDSFEELPKLRFSKYVQSYVGDCPQEIKKLLDAGKTVLFSGTPCQNAGLLKFLGKDYENLYTLDLLCHGVPSPKIWQDYLAANFDKPHVHDICFRSKDKGWVTCGNCFFDTGCSYVAAGTKKPVGIFYEAFLKHRLLNESCMDCKYRFVPRPADFTAGDFWSYYRYDKSLNDGKGLSVILLNSRKAEILFGRVRGEFAFVRRIPMRRRWEHIEITKKSRANPERNLLFAGYERYGVNRSLERAVGRHFDVALLSFFNGMNYGSALVAYAQNKILEDMGYSVVNVHKAYNSVYPYDSSNRAWEFARKSYYVTRYFERDESCRELNQIADTFIVGSDTQWWWNDVSSTGLFRWLDFADSSKRKISFCTSFANDATDIPSQEQKRLRYLYERFDALSVREKSGQDILLGTFGVKSECFADPTLLLEKKYYEELAAKSERTDTGYLLAYMLDLSPEKERYIKAASEELALPLLVIPRMSYNGNSELVTQSRYDIEDFVYLFMHAGFVITDSFHGACFSVIFEKKFLSFLNRGRGLSRYDVFYQMNLQDRFVQEEAAFDRSQARADVDWALCRAYIAGQRKAALAWLQEKLSAGHPAPANDDLLYDYLLYKEEAQDFIPRRIRKSGFRILRYAARHKKRVLGLACLCALFVLGLVVLIFVK